MIEARSLLVGFGLMFLVQNVANLIWGADFRGYSFLDRARSRSAARGSWPTGWWCSPSPWARASLLLAVLRWTLIGKAVRAMMQSPTGAQLVGIDTRFLHPVVFGVGIALAGVAGALLSMVYEISPGDGRALHGHRADRHRARRPG